MRYARFDSFFSVKQRITFGGSSGSYTVSERMTHDVDSLILCQQEEEEKELKKKKKRVLWP